MATQLLPGLAGEVSTLVNEEQTARHLGSGGLAVFATPAMVRLMEEAAVKALAGCLAEGQQSVGTGLNIRHLAPTPLGMVATARAELTAIEGRKLIFHVQVHDGVETIGEGTHERMIIDVQRFAARVAAKAGR